VIEWRLDQYLCWRADVPTRDGDRVGVYEIHIQRRPDYCDRGDWIIYVDARGKTSLDGADGFPRYFFGDADEVKAQMETWVSRRAECNAK
jgi:hypothetical protein